MEEAVTSILSRFLGHYREKLQELTFGIYSASLVNNANVIEILRRDPLYNPLVINMPQREYFQQEIPVYYRLLTHLDRLDQGQLLLDPKQWLVIAVLSESLLWLLNRTLELIKGIFQLPESFRTGFENLAEKVRFLLRVEFHCHSFYFLSGMITSDYVSRDENIESEKFVIDFNKNLVAAEETLRPVLTPSPSSMEFLLGTLPHLIELILIRNATAMQNKLINRQGQSRILRNSKKPVKF